MYNKNFEIFPAYFEKDNFIWKPIDWRRVIVQKCISTLIKLMRIANQRPIPISISSTPSNEKLRNTTPALRNMEVICLL